MTGIGLTRTGLTRIGPWPTFSELLSLSLSRSNSDSLCMRVARDDVNDSDRSMADSLCIRVILMTRIGPWQTMADIVPCVFSLYLPPSLPPRAQASQERRLGYRVRPTCKDCLNPCGLHGTLRESLIHQGAVAALQERCLGYRSLAGYTGWYE
jgi:hypothetical protein